MTNGRTNDHPAGRTMGRKIPNLVLLYDSGVGSEFRVQCEVPLANEDEAAQVKKDVMTGTEDSLKRAKGQILARVDPEATELFRQIVGQAFDDNIKKAQRQAAAAAGNEIRPRGGAVRPRR